MKETYRSRRPRLPRRRQQLTKPLTSDDDDDDDDDDEFDLFHQTTQQKSIVRSNKNANRMPANLFDTVSTLPTVEKQHQTLHSSPEPSSLLLYSINSLQKPTAISDDLTPLTITTTNTTPLTALTCSTTKQTELAKIDLTELSGTDTLDSSPLNSDHDQSLSLDRKSSSPDIQNIPNLTHTYDTDTSMRSVAFSKKNSSEEQLSYQKHASCFTIPGDGNGDCMTIASSSVLQSVSIPVTINTNGNTYQRPPVRWSPSRWNLPHITSRSKLLIGCSSLCFIAGILILAIIL